ncbi:FHA domain-containing protein [bacterium]|nr:FHA domain-containing protein [bacterium]
MSGENKPLVVRLSDFRNQCAGMALQLFLEKHPNPVLVVESKEGDFGEPGFQTLTAGGKAEDGIDADTKRKPDPPVDTDHSSAASTDLDIQVKPMPKGTVAQKHAEIAKKLEGAGTAQFVCPLVKRDVNKFASMITVGRAANNDVRLNLPSVSKFHAYFTHVKRDNAWFIADANSSNGTFVNGERLKSDKGRIKLENGSAIRLGPDVTVRFFDARSLYALLTSDRPFGDTPDRE